jgi:hypothetical protein
MPVVAQGTIALTRGVPVDLYEATPADFPSMFGGKVDLNALVNALDEIKLTLYTKYSLLGAYKEAETPSINAVKDDKILRITPTQEYFGFKLVIELTNASPSANANLDYVINKNVID